MSRLEPLPPETTPELEAQFGVYLSTLGFVPNSMLIMQRKPRIVEGITALNRAVMGPGEGQLDAGFKRLLGAVASGVAGCRYTRAHALHGAHRSGIPEEKLHALADYRTSALYADAERVAIDFAAAAAVQPSAVTGAHFEALRRHWSEAQIVEMLAAVAMYGFFSRWNSALDTELEPGAAHEG